MTHLIGLQAENFKRLRAVDISFDPAGGAVAIMGKNGAGKSSVLDAIEVALAGRKAPKMQQPIHKGADEARVIARFDDLVVTRRYRADGTTTIEAAGTDGRKYARTEEVLARLYSHIALDPLAFSALSDQEQTETLLGMLGVDLTPFQMEHFDAFQTRTLVNREEKSLAARVEALPPIDTKLPEEGVDVAALSERMAVALGSVAEQERLARELDRTGQAVEGAEMRLQAAIADLSEAQAAHDAAKTALRDAGEPLDPEPIRAQIESAREINARVQSQAERRRLVAERDAKHAESEALTERIVANATAKEAALAAARMPVPGLTISDDGLLLLDGIPFSQASTGIKIKTGTAIAMALNPDLRVIIIRDASLLDDDNRAVIDELARANGFLVLLEIANDGEPVGVVIEDGEVVEVRS